MTSLAIIAYFKDEAHILNEWIAHHISFGVSHFYLIDNGSSDNFVEAIEPHRSYVTLISDPHLGQRKAYKTLYPLASRQHDWVICLDLDEFLYIENFSKSIPDFLDTIEPHVMALRIRWTIFVPDTLQQPGSVIAGCKTACAKDTLSGRPFKTIFRTSIHVDNVNIHRPRNLQPGEMKTFKPEDKLLRLNHYRFQSYEFLLGIKSTRGSGVYDDRYRLGKTYQLLAGHLESSLSINDDLAQLSSELIENLYKTPQINPKIDIYNNKHWNSVVNKLGSEELDIGAEKLFLKVFNCLGLH